MFKSNVENLADWRDDDDDDDYDDDDDDDIMDQVIVLQNCNFV